jgi:peptidoglycan/xylan/chitin deacetylase (PgdA/CDA1 family)
VEPFAASEILSWRFAVLLGTGVLLLASSACLSASSPPEEGEILLAPWPDGHPSAVALTFEATGGGRAPLERLASLLRTRGINATFFVVAGYYESASESLEPLRPYEVASKAWDQEPWRGGVLTEEFQAAEIRKADRWLRDQGFSIQGFRAPLLRGSPATLRALEEMGYRYDSTFYFGFWPYWIGRTLEIPLSLGYDPFWNERTMRYSDLPTYLAFQKSHREGSLFTLTTDVLLVNREMEKFIRLLDFLQSRDVWWASCSEVLEWWEAREGLSLYRWGREVVVKNQGERAVSGATLLLPYGVGGVEGALSSKRRGGTLYVVIPEIPAKGEVRLRLSGRSL